MVLFKPKYVTTDKLEIKAYHRTGFWNKKTSLEPIKDNYFI